MMNIKNYEKAIEYLKNAEKLDSLNKDTFINKGICFLNLVKIITIKIMNLINFE